MIPFHDGDPDAAVVAMTANTNLSHSCAGVIRRLVG